MSQNNKSFPNKPPIKHSLRKLIQESEETVSHFKTAKLTALVWTYRYLDLLKKECKAEIKRRKKEVGANV